MGWAAVAAAGPAVAQDEPRAVPERGAVAGVAVTVTGQPVDDGEARLVELRRRARLGPDGSFRFPAVTPGSYLIEIASETFGRANERVTVAPGETAEVVFTLDLATVADEVVVTATPDARSQLEVAQPTSVLSGEELELRLEATLGETLDEQPGVSSTYFGPGASRPVIRGLGGDRVRMLSGGLGTADVSSTSPDHAVSADPVAAERIEVLRGPATLLYGSNAVGGVVNVLDDRIPSYVPDAALAGTVELLGGTAAEERTGSVTLEGGRGRWAWHADASRRDTSDYEAPGAGRLENSSLETGSGSLGLSYVTDRGFLGIAWSGFDSDYGVPGGHAEEGEEEHEGEEEEGPVRIDLSQRRLDLHGELARELGPLAGVKLRLGVTDYRHQELEGAEIGTRFDNDAWEGRLELVQRRRGDLAGSFGLQVSESDFAARGEEAFVPPSVSSSWAVFLFEELTQGPVSFELGGRFESREVDPEPAGLPARSLEGLSGSLGVVWQASEGYILAASLARTERLPTANELFAAGPHAATRTFEIGDPDLGREVSLGLDVSLRKRRGRLTGVFNVFVNRFDDYILERFTGEVEEGLAVVRFEQRDVELRGAELDAVVGLARFGDGHLDLLLRADYVEAELTGTGEPLPRIPPLRLGLGLSAHKGPWRGRVEVRRLAAQNDVADHETPTRGSTRLDATVSYRLLAGSMVADLQLKGTNLTDEEIRNHVSFLKDVAPLPGRDLALALRLRF